MADLQSDAKAVAEKGLKNSLGLPAKSVGLGLEAVVHELADLRNAINVATPSSGLNPKGRASLEKARAALASLLATPEDQDVSRSIVDLLTAVAIEIQAIRALSFWSGGGGYTDEQAQDAIGGILLDSGTIDFDYDDVIPFITADVVTNSDQFILATQIFGP